ncbi:MAG: hypothetical protein V1746_08360 [bacterium]
MATTKQIQANKQNALLSTGAITEEGKAIVSRNAVKHGIFVKDLLITGGDGREDAEEYRELLQNLITSLNPSNQMEHLLVEKIAVDFWRLRRVLRFETGSIRKYLDWVIDDYYSQTEKSSWLGLGDEKKHKTNAELDGEINEQKERIDWNKRYIKCLKKGVVSFDQATWENEELESNVEDDLFTVADEIKGKIMSEEESSRLDKGEMTIGELRAIFKKAGYTDGDIANELIPILQKQNENSEQTILSLERQKTKNRLAEEVAVKSHSLPTGEDAERVMKYEKAIQRSILQNLAVLKRLQSLP